MRVDGALGAGRALRRVSAIALKIS